MSRFGIILTTILVSSVGVVLWFLSGSPTTSPSDQNPEELVFRLDSFAINLYPPALAEVNSRRIGTLLHEPLIRMAPDGSPEPAIASAWTRTGNTWRFEIAKNARFSDGGLVTPADVESSICRSMQPSSSWGWSLTSILSTKVGDRLLCDGIVSDGDFVEIRQSYDAPWLIEVLSGPAGWIIPKDASEPGAYGQVLGAGRYRIHSIAADSYVQLEPVDKTEGLAPVRFIYVPDDVRASSLFKSGKLATLHLQSPMLNKLVAEQAQSSKSKLRYRVVTHSFDRVRILIINEVRLTKMGLSPDAIGSFRDALDTSIDREKLENLSSGLATAAATPLPVFGSLRRQPPSERDLEKLPPLQLTVITEPDAFSDQIAASLPGRIGNIRLDYRTVEKGLLIDSLVKKDFDIAAIVIEATMHSPKFWSAFFDPSGAFVAFGKPIASIADIDLSSEGAVGMLQDVLTKDSNWILLTQERRIDAVQPWVQGMRYNRAGQDDLSGVILGTAPVAQ
ncbi:ABC transporter substrate-binding protein [Parvibaculum sp.]|uniref:ABC transporter substrate-binding protein n=1 Tax=Parvibaculum sp. TaxID=2024848 RepID=UPI0026287CAE|nr:ABC transporter substrate-binding protein [Parvibaculum sp.]MCW5726222.1 hypothetical protein [Parvibaculum sp.]